MKKLVQAVIVIALITFTGQIDAKSKWISLFNGKDLTGWVVHGKATWTVVDGVMIGEVVNGDGVGHIYSDPTATDFEAKGTFRITGPKSNSGFYFRAKVTPGQPDAFPRGYEAQICHNQDASTGSLWKPGTPTGKATKLITKDGEWFTYKIRAVGTHIQFWINNKLVMTHDDDTYKTGCFALQVHNSNMKIEAKDLYYRNL
jgi:hypothetical protein